MLDHKSTQEQAAFKVERKHRLLLLYFASTYLLSFVIGSYSLFEANRFPHGESWFWRIVGNFIGVVALLVSLYGIRFLQDLLTADVNNTRGKPVRIYPDRHWHVLWTLIEINGYRLHSTRGMARLVQPDSVYHFVFSRRTQIVYSIQKVE